MIITWSMRSPCAPRRPVIRNVPIEKIVTNQMQPRSDMGDLTELDRLH